MRIASIKHAGLLGGTLVGVALGGCNSFDEPGEPESNEPRLVIPTDQRPAVTSATPLKSVSGGTLAVLTDDSAVIVSDPQRDLVSIVDLAGLSVRHSVKLQAGDEPGRIVEGAEKRVHVALRGAGVLLSLDAVTGKILERRSVCKAPRGVAFDRTSGLLHVACAEGKLVSLPEAGGEAVRTLQLETDLRDVLVRGSELWVTRFKTAEVLRVSAAGALTQHITIPRSLGVLAQPVKGSQQDGFGISDNRQVDVEAGVAWRAISNNSGGAMIVHQQAVVDEIELSEPSPNGSAYGGGFDCSGIVKNAITVVAPDGRSASTTFMGAPLPVDVALSPDQAWIAIAHAGTPDVEAPRPTVVFPGQDGASGGGVATPAGLGFGSSISIVAVDGLNSGPVCAFPSGGTSVSDPVTAVAFTQDGRLLAQTEQPAQLVVVTELPWGEPRTIVLPGSARKDTGHELFHRDAGGGIACASCHPEGGEDGKTWRFSGFGERRTQALFVGLRDTAPFHWAGDLPSMSSVMSEVFVGRMGGVMQSSDRLSALSEWVFSLTPPPSLRDASDEAAVRGAALFHSSEVGCSTCHSGAKLTNNQSVAVDTRVASKLQVPSLVAIGYRAPFMHDGCAHTLAARFNADCGGNDHGNVSSLSQPQLDDLVAYLESL